MKHHRFGTKSQSKLSTCDPRWPEIAELGLEWSPYDFSIVWGFRNETLQDAFYASGASKTPWPESKHNAMVRGVPASLAIDFAPWVNNDIPWKETHIFSCIAGSIIAAANHLGHDVRWGGDWDGDGSTTDQTLLDWGHIELVSR